MIARRTQETNATKVETVDVKQSISGPYIRFLYRLHDWRWLELGTVAVHYYATPIAEGDYGRLAAPPDRCQHVE